MGIVIFATFPTLIYGMGIFSSADKGHSSYTDKTSNDVVSSKKYNPSSVKKTKFSSTGTKDLSKTHTFDKKDIFVDDSNVDTKYSIDVNEPLLYLVKILAMIAFSGKTYLMVR